MKGARSQKILMDGILFDSLAEACMYCWCKEAQELGIIDSFNVQPHWELIPRSTIMKEVQLKTKSKWVERTRFQSCGYTADFAICYSGDLGLESVTTELGDRMSIIDVKGAYNKAATEFSLMQKMMWFIYKIHVNKVVVAYDPNDYSKETCAGGFFAMNGVPTRLPAECYQKDGVTLYAQWRRMFEGLPRIKDTL